MRRLLPLLLTLALVAGCSSDGSEPEALPSSTTTTSRTEGLPDDVATFVEGIATAGSVAFRATYHVLQKLGGDQTDLVVVSDPPSWQIRMGDLVFVGGREPATCRTSAKRCVGDLREQLLSPAGVFSNFFAAGPASALATDARRVTAEDAVFTERTVAGVALRCAAVPQRGRVVATYCVTPEGVVGFADSPSVHYELTEYRAGPPGEPTAVPYEITGDGGFLTEG